MKLPPSLQKLMAHRATRVILGTSILVLAASPLTQGAINIFTHSASTSWANLSNWSLGHAPTSTDALEFTDPMANSTLDGSYTVQSLSFNTSNTSTFWNVDAGASPATLNLTGGGTNALGGTALLAMGSNSSVDVNIGVTAGDAALTINFGSANGTINVAAPNSILTLGSHVILTGSAGITFSGLGIVNLSGTNSYTGPTTVSNQSELNLQSALPASSAFTNNGLTRVSISGTNVLGSSLSGNGTLTFSPSQNITLPSATAYTGSISLVSGDTLTLGMSDTFGVFNQTPASTINIGSGAVLTNSGAFFNTLNNLTIAGGELRATGGSSSTFPAYQLKGTVSVSANSSFTATGTTNSFTGIQLGNNTAGGVTTFNFTQAGVSLSIANVLQDGENTTGTATVPSGLAVTGSGTLILTAANTYTGPTTISGGTLQLNNTLYNSGTTTATLTVNSGGTLTLAGSNTFGASTSTPATSLIVQSGGLVQNSGAVFNTFNNLTINGGTLQANGGASATFPAYQLKGTVTVGGTGASAFTVGSSLTNSFTGVQLGNNTAGGITTCNIANATASLSIAPALVDGENTAGTATVSSGLTLTGAGTLTLAGANTYSGPTSISGGNLVLGGSLYSVSGAGAIDVGSGGTLTFSHNDTFGNAIAVPASTITIEAGGLVTNSNAVFNTFNNLTLNGGELRANGGFSATFPAYSLKGTVTANGPVTSTITANTSLSSFDGILIGDFSDNGPTTFNVTNSAGTLSIAASLFNNPSESSSLTKTGPGTLQLNAANSYSGITTINGGTLSVSSLANGGSPSGVGQSSNAAANLILNGGVLLDTGASNTTDRLFTLGTSGGEIDTSGAVTFTNTGAIVLSGTNTARALTLGGTGTGTLSGILGDNGTGASSLLKNGAGTWILTGANTYTGLTTINAGTLQIGNGGTSGSIAGSVADNSALVFDRSDNVTYAGAITSAGSVVQMGTGVLSLTSTGNNYSGGTSVQAGVLAFNSLGTGSVTLASGTELRALSNASLSNITLPSSGTATLSAAPSATFSVSNLTLSPGFSLVFGSAGNTGVVAFNGTGSSADPSATITVAFGTLLNQGLGPITGTVASTTVNAGGTLDVHDLNLTINNLLGSGNVTLGSQSATRLTLLNANFGGVISGAGGVQIASSTDVHFSGANTYTGPTNINSGNLWVDGSLYHVTGPGTINVLPGAALVLSHSDTFGTFTQSSSVAVNIGGVIVNSGASFNTFNNLTFNGGQLIANGGLNSTFQAFQLKGTVTVNAAATSTIVNAGGVNAFTGIQLGNNTAGGVTTFNVTDPNGVLQVNCVFMDGENTGGTASVSSGLTKIGPGTLQLTAANTYSGVTTINGGTLSVSSLANGGSPSGVGQSSNAAANLILNGSTLLDTGAGDTTDRLFTLGTSGGEIDTSGAVTFTNTGAIVLSGTNTARALTLGGTGTGTLSAVLGDNGTGPSSLIKTGTGTWILANAQTYSGNTNINGGTLQMNPGASLYGSTGPGTIDVGSGAALVLARSDTFGNFAQTSGTTVIIEAGGQVSDSGAFFNTFTNLIFNGGQLIANGGVFQAFQLKGTVTVNGLGTSLIQNAASVNAFTGIQLGNNTAGGVTTFNVVNFFGALQVNCALTDGENASGTASVSSGLTKIGPGTLQLTAANTYTGVTTINGGTLSVGFLANGGSPGGVGQTSNAPSNLILNGGTLLDTGGSDTTDRLFTLGTSGGEIDTTGSVTFTNTGAIALPGTNTARTLILGGTGTGSLAAILSDNGSGATSLLKIGSGTWSLSSAQPFTGGTTIQGGTLTLDFTQANSPLANILAPTSPLAITDGTLAIKGSSSASNSQTFNHITLAGGTFIQLNPGSGQTETLNIGTLTRNPGAVLALPYPPGSPGGIFYSGGTAGNLVTDSNGVPYIISGEDWAVKDPTNTYIVNGASIPNFYTSNSNLAGNALIFRSINATTGTTQLSSLAITNSSTITLGNSALLTPGILTRTSSNSNTISGGILGSPMGELVIYNNPASTLTLNTSVVDSGRQTALTKGGPGTLVMNFSPSYTGATTISGGQFNLNAAINTPSANVTIDGPLSAAPQLSMQTASSLTAANLYVGVNGTGSLINVPNFLMAQITIGQNLYIASGTGSTGTVTLQSNTNSGATASLNVGGNIYLATAPGSTGTLTLNYDTTVQATSIIGGQGNSVLNFTGGIIEATPQTTELFSGIKQFNAAGYYDCIDTDGNNAVSISQPLTGNWTLAKLGIGTLTLSAADTTAVAIQGGTLRLDFSRSGAPLANILSAQDSLPVYNATLAIQGSNSAPVSQTFQSFSPYGATAVRVTSGTGGATTLNLGPINNPYNATVDFTLPANGSIQTSSGSGGSSILAANGYAYATVNGTDWAAMDPTNTHIVAGSSVSGFYTPATATSLSGNADVPAGVTAITLPSGPPAISSLRFNQPQSSTLTISDTLTAGGILITSAVGANTIQINGGTLQGGTSLSIIQDDTVGSVNISSSISTTNFIKSGPGPATLSGSYNNWLFVFGGTLTLSGTIQNSGTLRVDGPIENPSSVIIAAGASVNQSQLMLGTVTYGNCIQNGGSAQFGSVQLGSFPGSGGHGSGGSYTLNAGSLVTGPMNFNNASFVQNGGTVQASSLTYYFGATAQYTLNAGSLTLSSLSTEDNGFVQTGGTVTVTGGNSTLLNGPYSLSSSGILHTNGETINASFLQTGGTHTDSNSFTLNSIATGYTLSGSATLSVPNATENLSSQFIQNGGTNSAAGVFDGATIPYALNGGVLQTNSIGGTFNLNGGILRATGNASWFALLNVQAGGASLDTNGFNASVGALFHDLSPATPAIDGGLTKLGAGILDILGTETYTGPTRIVGGSLQLDGTLYGGSGAGAIDVGSGATLLFSHNDTFGHASSIPASTITIEAGGLVTNQNPVFNTLNNLIFNGGELRANGGVNASFPAYSLKGTVTANGAVTSTITANTSLNSFNGILIGDSGDNGSTTFNVTDPAGTLSIAPGLFDNSGVSGGLTKAGPGSLILSGASTYSGPTQVNQGKVFVRGSLFGTANVTVGDGTHAASLGGNGTITPANGGAITVASGATLAPDAGGLTIDAMPSGTASLAFQANSTLQLSIANNQSSTQGAPALGDYAALTLGTGVTTTLSGLLAINVSGPINYGDVFPILLSSVAVSGYFSNANSSSALAIGPSSFSFISGGHQWEINYAWNGNVPFTGEGFADFAQVTGGTDVALLAVPEPGVAVTLFGSVALLLGWQRRRKGSPVPRLSV